MDSSEVRYSRAKFSTRLHGDRLYTAGHSWLLLEAGSDDVWRIGLTKFGVRMLGEAVEVEFEAKDGATIELGDVVGWIEGFKAVSDLYAPMGGLFRGGNSDFLDDLELLRRDPYGKGWLYRIQGSPAPDCVDVQGYVEVLDRTIDKMLGKQGETDKQ